MCESILTYLFNILSIIFIIRNKKQNLNIIRNKKQNPFRKSIKLQSKELVLSIKENHYTSNRHRMRHMRNAQDKSQSMKTSTNVVTDVTFKQGTSLKQSRSSQPKPEKSYTFLN
ncbi:hypothetical protein V6Z12_D01G224500 [Gossypium hirsutum]